VKSVNFMKKTIERKLNYYSKLGLDDALTPEMYIPELFVNVSSRLLAG